VSAVHEAIHHPQLQAFREQIRDFCAASLADDLRRKTRHQNLEKADYVRWHKCLHSQGWIGGHWPTQYGGQGWSRLQRFIFDEEVVRCGAPPLLPFGPKLIGPVIYTFGNERQKQRHLPAILSGQVWWCQGYSEPGAGSDLASVSTRARRQGDQYVVTGQKTWTTMAHWADMMFALVRTSDAGDPRHGLSMLLIDMQSAGLSVRPIRGSNTTWELNDVFFDAVTVPADNLIGEENQGWKYSRFLLNEERFGSADIGRAKRRLDLIGELIASGAGNTSSLTDRRLWDRTLAELSARLLALESLCVDLMDSTDSDQQALAASIIKIVGSELGQSLMGTLLSIAAPDGLRIRDHSNPDDFTAAIVREHLHERAASIYSGSNEIQRDIVARMLFAGRGSKWL
jgi:alkylation response protein AidB-like acyl-CoA dehydrogenase